MRMTFALEFSPEHLTATHFLLSLSFIGQATPLFFSLFIIFLILNFLPLLHFLEHDVQGDHPVTMQSKKSERIRVRKLNSKEIREWKAEKWQ